MKTIIKGMKRVNSKRVAVKHERYVLEDFSTTKPSKKVVYETEKDVYTDYYSYRPAVLVEYNETIVEGIVKEDKNLEDGTREIVVDIVVEEVEDAYGTEMAEKYLQQKIDKKWDKFIEDCGKTGYDLILKKVKAYEAQGVYDKQDIMEMIKNDSAYGTPSSTKICFDANSMTFTSVLASSNCGSPFLVTSSI